MVNAKLRLRDTTGRVRDIFKPKTKPKDIPFSPPIDTSGRPIVVSLPTALDIAEEQRDRIKGSRTFRGGGGGGGGGGGAPVSRARGSSTAEILARQRAEAERLRLLKLQAQNQARATAERIQREQFEANKRARIKFQNSLKTARNQRTRNFIRDRFNREKQFAQLKANARRQKSGISRFVGRPSRSRGEGVALLNQSEKNIQNNSVLNSVNFIADELKKGRSVSINESGFLFSKISSAGKTASERLESFFKILSKRGGEKAESITERLVPGVNLPIGFSVPGTRFGKKIKFRDITNAFFKVLENKGFSKERIAKIITSAKINSRVIDNLKITQSAKNQLKNIIVGGLKQVEEDPEQIILLSFVAGASPGALAKIGASPTLIKALSKIPPKVKKLGATAITRSLQGAYLTSVGLRVGLAEKKGEKFGRILVGEVAPFSLGTKLGIKGLMRQELKNELVDVLKTMPKKNKILFQKYMEQAEVFGKFESKANNIKLNNINNIPKGDQGKIAQKVIRKFLKEKDIIIGGSVAQTGQIKVDRPLGDIDGYKEFKNVGKNTAELNKLAKQLESRLKKAGVNRVKATQGETRIAGKKTIEFHDISRIKANIEQVTPNWANWKRYIIKTPEGIRIQRIGVQAKRKLVAGLADPGRAGRGVSPKDLKDFKKISNVIFRNAVRKSRNAFFFKKSKLKELEKIFGRKIPRLKKVKKIKEVTKFKKPKKLKIRTKAPKKAKVKGRITKAPKKAKVIRGKGIKKISRKVKVKKIRLKVTKKVKKISKRVRIKKIKRKPTRPSQKPSQRPSQRPKIIPPSQPPRRPPKKPTPSQPPRRPPKKPKPSQPPRRPQRFPPSQPPAKPPKGHTPPPPPPPPPTKKVTTTKKKTRALIPITSKLRKVKIVKGKAGYDVFFRKSSFKGKKIKGKQVFVKANRKPLTLKQAKDRGIWIVNNSVARTFKVKRVGKIKKLGAITRKEIKHFQKNKKILRKFKKRKGVRKPLTRKWIEKRKFAINTSGERLGLSGAQALAKLRKPKGSRPRKTPKKFLPIKKIKIKPVKRLSLFQMRQIRLNNLKKARASLNKIRSSKSGQKIKSPQPTRRRRSPVQSVSRKPQPVRKTKSGLSQKQLNNLRLGRMKRLKNLKRSRR